MQYDKVRDKVSNAQRCLRELAYICPLSFHLNGSTCVQKLRSPAVIGYFPRVFFPRMYKKVTREKNEICHESILWFFNIIPAKHVVFHENEDFCTFMHWKYLKIFTKSKKILLWCNWLYCWFLWISWSNEKLNSWK